MNERILALDIGDRRIGVAVSDAGRVIAQPVEVITRVGYGPDVRRITELCAQFETVNVLSGLPLNMDGTEGFQAQKVRAFCEKLQQAGMNVFFQDERMTTVTAEKALIEGDVSRLDRKSRVDKVAAAVILQQWLDRASNPVKVYFRSEETNMDENNNLIELIDEDGESVQFEHLMTLEHETEYYIVLMTAQSATDEDAEEGEVVILKLAKDDKGEDCYVSIDDDDVAQAVYEKFIAIIEEEDDAIPEDFEEDDEDEE